MAATTESDRYRPSAFLPGQRRAVQLDLPDDAELTLLDVLRDFLGITSPKNGCQPQAQCGCCTVLMDGKPVLACALSPAKAEGKSITTLEGLDEEHRAADCRFVRPLRRRAVRVLHSGHGDAGGRAVRKERGADARGNRSLTEAAFVPLHGLRADRRQHRTCTPSCVAASRAASLRRE